MFIACLGWGSLVWDPRKLPVRGTWFTDGPFLPIEFARQSSDDRITLVLVPSTFPLVRSLWQPLSVRNLAEARDVLGMRECKDASTPRSCVDYWPHGTRNTFVRRQVRNWAQELQVDAVVWTNLCPRFRGRDGTIPSSREVVSYLRGLRGRTRNDARRYIRMTPKQIDTDYRRAIEDKLGWSCQSRV
jgi:hypothetical protein